MLLERELEQIIFDGVEEELGRMVSRGFYCPIKDPKWIKQQYLGAYGIPDLLCFGKSKVTGSPHVIIYELKRHLVGARNLIQLTRYMAGVRHWLIVNGIFNEDSKDIDNAITGVLVGTSIDDTFAGFLGSRIKMLTASYSPFNGITFNDFSGSVGLGDTAPPEIPYATEELFASEDELIEIAKDPTGEKYKNPLNRTLHYRTSQHAEDIRIISRLISATLINDPKIPHLGDNFKKSFDPKNHYGFMREEGFCRVLNLTGQGIKKIFPGTPPKQICEVASRWEILVRTYRKTQRQIRMAYSKPWFYSFNIDEAKHFIDSIDEAKTCESLDMFVSKTSTHTEHNNLEAAHG